MCVGGRAFREEGRGGGTRLQRPNAFFPRQVCRTKLGSSPAAAAPAGMPIAARAITDDAVTLVTLDNGMTVIVKPMRTAPV